jgi:hypothetical protein
VKYIRACLLVIIGLVSVHPEAKATPIEYIFHGLSDGSVWAFDYVDPIGPTIQYSTLTAAQANCSVTPSSPSLIFNSIYFDSDELKKGDDDIFFNSNSNTTFFFLEQPIRPYLRNVQFL